MIIRDADPQRDAAACAAIYGPYVSGSVASFEARPPTVAEMSGRIGAAYAWVVAEHAVTLGYAYGSPHHERAAYRWAADVAVYIDAGHHRAGVGRALYTHLFEQLRAIGLWTLCAGITQPNDASNGLHRAMGFAPVGTYRRIGWKAGAWHDVEWLQLDLRPGEPGPPRQLRVESPGAVGRARVAEPERAQPGGRHVCQLNQRPRGEDARRASRAGARQDRRGARRGDGRGDRACVRVSARAGLPPPPGSSARRSPSRGRRR